MKEFNLERALAGDPVTTETGMKAEIIKDFSRLDGSKRLAVLITIENGDMALKEYFMSGRAASQPPNYGILFMAQKKVTRWYNLYKDGPGHYFKNRVDAEESKGGSIYLETRSIEWEE